jgi:hypothetical protein
MLKTTKEKAFQGLRPLSPARRLGMPSFHFAEPTLPPRPALLQVAIRRRHLRISKTSVPSLKPSSCDWRISGSE